MPALGLCGRLLSGLLDVLAPPGCAACDAPTREVFCAACGKPAACDPSLLDGVPLVVAGNYVPPLSTAIVRFKYGGRADLARLLAAQVAPALSRLALTPAAVLVPVPLHPRRLATRGYNQAALLAQELARQCSFDCDVRLLKRSRETERQVGKTRAHRLTNARGAFELRRAGPPSIVLVDDVVTTGSTVRACAQALAEGGVRLAAVVALAEARHGT